jgi:hypothetical protein
MTTTATVETVGELGQRLTGAVLTPVSPGYDEVRRVHNGLVDKRPAVIARRHRSEARAERRYRWLG